MAIDAILDIASARLAASWAVDTPDVLETSVCFYWMLNLDDVIHVFEGENKKKKAIFLSLRVYSNQENYITSVI